MKFITSAELAAHKNGLWADDPSTPSQRLKYGRQTQHDVLASLLREARSRGAALELPDIKRTGIAQHGARISELRERRLVIRNEIKRSPDGTELLSYRLTFDPERDVQP